MAKARRFGRGAAALGHGFQRLYPSVSLLQGFFTQVLADHANLAPVLAVAGLTFMETQCVDARA